MENLITNGKSQYLSPWWKRSIIIILILEFIVLIWVTTGSYYKKTEPPIPGNVVDASGSVIFSGSAITAGQQLFLQKAMMNNGSIWGHGAYIGPDFSAQYLHNLALEVNNFLAAEKYNEAYTNLSAEQKKSLLNLTHDYLTENRYNPQTHDLLYTEPEMKSFNDQKIYWKEYFQSPSNRGLAKTLMVNDDELNQLTSFFSWAAWASTADVPGKNHSYTNNFPYEPLIDNGPSSAAILWSALSLISLLAGIGLILLIFGRFHYLGWKELTGYDPPQLLPGNPTRVERATLKFFMVAVIILLVQTFAGAAMAHYFVEPEGFFGFDLSSVLPSNILRSWHL